MLSVGALSRGFRRPLNPTEIPKPACYPVWPGHPTTRVVERPFLAASESMTFLENRPVSSPMSAFVYEPDSIKRTGHFCQQISGEIAND